MSGVRYLLNSFARMAAFIRAQETPYTNMSSRYVNANKHLNFKCNFYRDEFFVVVFLVNIVVRLQPNVIWNGME